MDMDTDNKATSMDCFEFVIRVCLFIHSSLENGLVQGRTSYNRVTQNLNSKVCALCDVLMFMFCCLFPHLNGGADHDHFSYDFIMFSSWFCFDFARIL